MTEPTIAVSTREWQRCKLGPSLAREHRWLRCDLYRLTVALRPLAGVAVATGRSFAAFADAAADLIDGSDG